MEEDTSLPVPAAELLPGQGTGTRLLAFGGSWSGPWRLLQEALDAIEGKGVEVVRIDVMEHPDLADRWAVVSVPTFVVTLDGQQRKRYVGAVSGEELLAGTSTPARLRTNNRSKRRR